MRKALIAVVVASALFAVGAFAASFAVESEDVASGSDAVEACADKVNIDFSQPEPNDTSGEYEVASATVQFLTDAGVLTAGCEGYSVQLALVYDGAAVNYGPETLPIGATSYIFTLDDPTLAELITSASVAVDGKTLFTVTTP